MEKIVDGVCPKCFGKRRADIVAEHNASWIEDTQSFWQHKSYRILNCRGCQTVYFQVVQLLSEFEDSDSFFDEVEYFPNVERSPPIWFHALQTKDQILYELMRDTYKAIDNDMLVLAAIGVRTSFDRATEHLGIDPAQTFKDKIANLANQKLVGHSEQAILDVLTNAGSAAAHRGWKPSLKDVDLMMTVLESFVFRTCVGASEISDLKNRVPAKPPRKGSTTQQSP